MTDSNGTRRETLRPYLAIDRDKDDTQILLGMPALRKMAEFTRNMGFSFAKGESLHISAIFFEQIPDRGPVNVLSIMSIEGVTKTVSDRVSMHLQGWQDFIEDSRITSGYLGWLDSTNIFMDAHEQQGNSGSRCVKNCRFIRPLSFEVLFDTLANCLKLKKKKKT